MIELVKRWFKPLLLFLSMAFIVLFVYFSDVYSQKPLDDDRMFETVMDTSSVSEAAFFYYHHVNGRLASHFVTCAVFKAIKFQPLFYVAVNILFLLLFVLALWFLLKQYLERYRSKSAASRNPLLMAFLITVFFYYFFFEGRIEVWYWVSSTSVYITSYVLAFLGFGLLIGHYANGIRYSVPPLLFFLSGGFAESNALLYVMVLFAMIWLHRKQGWARLLPYGLSIAAIAGGLLINGLSGGLTSRLGWLPEFDFLYALKNTFHSMALPLIRLAFLPVKLALIALLVFYARQYSGKWSFDKKMLFEKFAWLFVFAFVSFYFSSVLLSDIVPNRAASAIYLLGTLLLFDYFVFSPTKMDTLASS